MKNTLGIRKHREYNPNIRPKHVSFKREPLLNGVNVGRSYDGINGEVFTISVENKNTDVYIQLDREQLEKVVSFFTEYLKKPLN